MPVSELVQGGFFLEEKATQLKRLRGVATLELLYWGVKHGLVRPTTHNYKKREEEQSDGWGSGFPPGDMVDTGAHHQ